jgi:hypothetical protein
VTTLLTARRVVVSLLLAAAVFGVVWAFTMHEETEPIRLTHVAVKVVSPAPGEQVPRQATVFVELKPGYTLNALQVQGRAIGGDDLEHIAGLNRWSFTPGDGMSIEELDEGRNCAVAEFHRNDASSKADTFTWCFSLH